MRDLTPMGAANWDQDERYLHFLWALKGGIYLDHLAHLTHFEPILGCDVREAFDEMWQLGCLRAPEAEESLAELTVKQLKPLLQENGLKVSGKKAELIERILKGVDAEHLPKVKEGGYRLTSSALERVISWDEDRKQKRDAIGMRAYALIKERRIEEAVAVACDFEASKVFPRGMGTDWKSPSLRARMAGDCRLALQARPLRLKSLSEEQLEKVRLACVVHDLCATYMDSDWLLNASEPISEDSLCDFILDIKTNISFQATQRVAVESGTKLTYQVVRVAADCQSCQAVDGVVFDPGSAPELPMEECTGKPPCLVHCTLLVRPLLDAHALGFNPKTDNQEDNSDVSTDRELSTMRLSNYTTLEARVAGVIGVITLAILWWFLY